MKISRRAFGPLAAASALLAGGTGAAHARSPSAGLRGPLYDLTTPEGNVGAFAKISSDLSGKTTHGWYRGVLMGMAPGGPIRDLVGIIGMSSQRLEPLADGPGWQLLQKECGFFTDLATGAVLERWTNPYTNETVEPFHIANASVSRRIEPVVRDARFYDTAAGGAARERPFVLAWDQAGDRLFVETRAHVWANNPLDPAVWRRESHGAQIQVSDCLAYSCSARDLQDPRLSHVDHAGHWVHVRPWQPWMLMGRRPGACLYSAFTGSAGTLDVVPEEIAAVVRARLPAFLEAPRVLTRSEPSLVRYRRERAPVPIETDPDPAFRSPP
jgi:hypothetical protein